MTYFVFCFLGFQRFFAAKDNVTMMRNLLFWPEEKAGTADLVENRSVSRCWCDPSSFVDVVGVDFGSGGAHLYSSATGRAWKVNAGLARDEIVGLPTGTLVVCEWAHLAQPRTAKSLAQPFSADDLLDLYMAAKSAGVTIKLFPHYHSGTRARPWAALRFPEIQSSDKTDAADAMAISIYVSRCNAISLADPPASFSSCDKRDYGKAVRAYSSITLNAERTTGYRGIYFPRVINLGQEIFRKRGRAIGDKACYSIASLIATEINGLPAMFVRNGSHPGVELWWRHVARMTPFHHKGGLARSNMMRHSFRPFLRKFGNRVGVFMGSGAKLVPFGDHDDAQATARTKAMKSFRDAVKDCYRVGVKIADGDGFAKLDPIQTPWKEATDGRQVPI